MQSSARLALLALLVLPVAGCRTPKSKSFPITTGNMVVTVAPQKLSTPSLLITYDSGSSEVFGAFLKTNGEGFEIESVDGWFPMESESRLEVEDKGTGDRILFTDDLGKSVEVVSKVTDLDASFISNVATGDWYEFDSVAKQHNFAVYLIYKDAVHAIRVRAKK